MPLGVRPVGGEGVGEVVGRGGGVWVRCMVWGFWERKEGVLVVTAFNFGGTGVERDGRQTRWLSFAEEFYERSALCGVEDGCGSHVCEEIIEDCRRGL